MNSSPSQAPRVDSSTDLKQLAEDRARLTALGVPRNAWKIYSEAVLSNATEEEATRAALQDAKLAEEDEKYVRDSLSRAHHAVTRNRLGPSGATGDEKLPPRASESRRESPKGVRDNSLGRLGSVSYLVGGALIVVAAFVVSRVDKVNVAPRPAPLCIGRSSRNPVFGPGGSAKPYGARLSVA
jgi:hypothetical protein